MRHPCLIRYVRILGRKPPAVPVRIRQVLPFRRFSTDEPLGNYRLLERFVSQRHSRASGSPDILVDK